MAISNLSAPAPRTTLPVGRATSVAGVDLTTQVWGLPIQLSQGLRAVTGVPLWASAPIYGPEVVETIYTGGIVGNPYVQTRTRQIMRNFAMGFGYNLAPEGEAEPAQIRRLWVNGVLFYQDGAYVPLKFNTATGNNYLAANTSGSGGGLQLPGAISSDETLTTLDKRFANLRFRFYGGTEEQLPDTAIAADKGDLAPAFRGMIYMVIEGLVVGTQRSQRAYGFDWVSGTNNDFQTIEPLDLPTITAELVDGTSVNLNPTAFAMNDTSYPTFGQKMFVDWKGRRVKIVAGDSSSESIVTFDLDAEAQEGGQVVTSIGSGDYLYEGFGWETEGGYIVAHGGGLSNSTTILVADAETGVEVSRFGANSSNLSPRDEDGGDPYVTGKPAVSMPLQSQGDIGMVIVGGDRIPILMAGNYDVGVYAFPGGQLPTGIPQGSFYHISNGSGFFPLGDVCPLRLADRPDASQYQDECFLTAENLTTGAELWANFVSYRGLAATIIGRKKVYSEEVGRVIVRVFLDSQGQVCLLSRASVGSTGSEITKLRANYDSSPEFGSAAGWRGVFPHINPAVDLGVGPVVQPIYSRIPLSVNSSNRQLKLSNLSFDTALISTSTIVDLSNGSSRVDANLNLKAGSFNFWDSAVDTVFYRGNPNTMYKLPLGHSFTAEQGQLKDYLRWLALRAGYTVGQLDVDSGLTDAVLGVLITTPYDSTTLFSDLGQLYDFSFFESGGKIKFVRSSRNPVKASGLLTSTGNPADGDTVTVGAAVYTFKDTMAAPFDVKRGAVASESLSNLVAAINADGEEGVNYYAGTSAHPKVFAEVASETTAKVTARQGGLSGNSVPLAEASSVLNWSGAALTGGLEPPPPSIGFTIDDLAPLGESGAGDNEVLVTTLASPTLAPGSAKLNYMDVNQDYKVNSQTYTADDQGLELTNNSVKTLNVPFILTASEAYLRVSKIALRSGEQNTVQEFRLPWRYSLFEPSDVVSITIGPYQYIVQMDEVTFNGDFSLSCSGYNYSFRDDVYVPPQQQLGSIPQTVPGPGDGVTVVLDAPLLDPLFGTSSGDIPVFTGVRSYGQAGWTATTVSFSIDGSESMIALYTATQDLKYGLVQGVLPDTDTPFLTDEGAVLSLVLKSASSSDFLSATYDGFVSGANCLAVGKEGRWEYIFFRDVEVVSSTVVRLSGLSRGRRGTEVNTGNHQSGDLAVLMRSDTGLQATLRAQSFELSQVGQDFRWLASGVPARRPPAATVAELKGYALYPWAPQNVKAALEVGDDVSLSWSRRDRLAVRDEVTDVLALSEGSERYDLEILAGASIVRTLTDLTSPAYTYTAADQATDGFTSPLSSIKVRVYQKGALGRGFMKETTVNVE